MSDAQTPAAPDDDLPPIKVFTLSVPVTLGADSWDQIELHEPDGDELEKMAEYSSKPKAMTNILALLARRPGQVPPEGVPPKVIGKIKARDIKKMMAYVSAFAGDDQPIGNIG